MTYKREGNTGARSRHARNMWEAHQLKAMLLRNDSLHYRCDESHRMCLKPIEWARIDRRVATPWDYGSVDHA